MMTMAATLCEIMVLIKIVHEGYVILLVGSSGIGTVSTRSLKVMYKRLGLEYFDNMTARVQYLSSSRLWNGVGSLILTEQ